ncbi:UbiA family prenyltransferase, partial [Aspergillus ibericus CBS 121593]
MTVSTEKVATTTTTIPDKRIPSLLNPLHLLKTLYLFTESDFLTFVIPNTLFGIFSALRGAPLTPTPIPPLTLLHRLPLILLWNWLNLLIFDLANQRHPTSLLEDTINKPWRPLPSGLITIPQTRRLLLLALPLILLLNFTLLGPWQETCLLYILTWIYNDLGAGDHDGPIIRNLVIACAFSQYNKGSLRMATLAPSYPVPITTWSWLAITSAVIGTTMHVQDLKDQDGDRAKNRQTAPLVWGDSVARWTIAVPVGVWSLVCPWFWG